MGQVTASGIWTPDEADLGAPNVFLATMAASIEEGMGERLTQQEIAVGLKASSNGWTIPKGSQAVTTIPFSITTGNADFALGIELAGGIATIQTNGMYLVTASLGPQIGDTAGGMKVNIVKGGTVIAGSEVQFNPNTWSSAQVTSVVNCAEGDTISARASLSGTPAQNHVTYGPSTYLSIAMVQAVLS